MQYEETDLVERVLAGRTDDFRLLVDRYQQTIFRFAAGMLGNREEAQDVTQECFLAAFAHLASYESSRASVSTWLFTIARNRCLNVLKKSRPEGLEHPEALSGNAMTDDIIGKETADQLDRALNALPVDQRAAFVLAEIEELPYIEIARIEQTSLGTVKSRIHRAKRKLQSMLDPVMRESK